MLAVLAVAGMASLVSTTSHAMLGGACYTCTGTNGLPQLTIGNGGLHHAEVVPIFWGSSWTAPQQAQVVGMIQYVLNGAYTSALAQYGGNGIQVGPARMVPTAPTISGTPQAHCNNGAACSTLGSCSDGSVCGLNDIPTQINAVISAGSVPPPNSNADMLYVVFPPSGFTNYGYNAQASYNGTGYEFAWIPGYDSKLFTHELAEAITQNVATNCPGHKQLADLCECWNGETQGVQLMAAYWSQADSACVVPEGWNGVWAYNGTPNSWTQISTTGVRQVSAGGFGLVIADEANNLLKWGGGSSWTNIGGLVAQVAVGTSNIVRLSPAADAVDVYNGSGWTNIHGSRSAVYAGSRIVTTDFTGTEYSWLGSGDSWANIGKAGDQIVVTGTGRVYGIALDHSAVWMTPDNSGVWSKVGAQSSELFGGLTANPAGTPLQVVTSRDIWMYQSGTTWLRQNGPGVMFALAGTGPGLFMLTPTRSAVLQSNNINVTNPTWTQIAGSGFAKIVGSGNQLFAVGNPGF